MTICITLPNGSEKNYDEPVLAVQVAKDISHGLAKKAVAVRVDAELCDLDTMLRANCKVEIVTAESDEGLDIIRHSTAHLLAHAVKRLYGEKVKIAIGPTIEDGFYYDIDSQRPFSPDDLTSIEKAMKKLVKENLPVERMILSREEALKIFSDLGEDYKVEIIESLSADETISAYRQGDFIDLCRGPHVMSTGKIRAFKLTKIAGSYWRGDANNQSLQRIYGTAWDSESALTEYLEQIKEAEKRDHRLLAQTMDLYHLQEEAPGMIFWHAKGWRVFQKIITYIRGRLDEQDYDEVSTPVMMDQKLWVASGHWEVFADNMFSSIQKHRDFCIKPMNCPGNIQVFNQGLKSYRDLPVRMGEFGVVHRNEASGTLHGLMRLIQFTQDDAHIFCTPAQLASELHLLIDLVFTTYHDFGFENIGVKVATRPEKRIGDDSVWDQSESSLKEALRSYGVAFEELPGEGAFYGPKIEFHLTDCLKRVWQCGTIQLDFSMPDRLGASYVDETGTKKAPIMIHRAIFGSIERFMGILIEHYAGWLPLWLSPQPLVVCTITDRAIDHGRDCVKALRRLGIQCHLDQRNEKVGYKIREHTLAKVPLIAVIGDQEVANQTLAIRQYNGKSLGQWSLPQLIDALVTHISQRKNTMDFSEFSSAD